MVYLITVGKYRKEISMINIIICDDNQNDREKAIKCVEKFMTGRKLEFKIYPFNDYNNKFNATMNSNLPMKIYLLDIETPSSSGIDIARKIRKTDVDSVIIFLTGHEELGNIILKNDLMFLSFINKFDDFNNRLSNSLNKALDLLKNRKIIRLNDRNITYTIDINDILYITTDSYERRTIIKTDYNEIKVNKSLSEIKDMLDDRFIQTHRACYINNERRIKVDKTNKIITFDNGETIDLLSDKYKRNV